MVLEGNELLKLLINENYISKEDGEKASTAAKETPIEYLLDQEIINHKILGQAIAEKYKTTYFNLGDNEVELTEEAIPEDFARTNRLVCLSKKDKTFATDELDKLESLKTALAKQYKIKSAKISYADSEDINTLLSKYKKPLTTRFSKIIELKSQVAPEMINEIISDAVAYKASDIHFDPQEAVVIVRFRVDGVLQEAGQIPSENYENIVNRIKVLSQLRIDEHFATQDGAIRLTINDSDLDLRISIAPTLYGEKITIRLLAQYVKNLSLSELGLSDREQKLLIEAAKKPFGMILVTGPTGSGKSTSLYALIKHINNDSINITTIEDPVEYRIPGTNQIQVNEDKDITFAKGLRSIVRQDPDIILVGEIRDEETAEISINAALTGHLLFTTFHANDSATSIPRLLDMGVEPFLLASTLNLVIAQRLVRSICTNCRYSEKISKAQILEQYPGLGHFFEKENTLYRGKGCDICNGTGYKGRVGIFELMLVTPELKALMLTSPSTDAINEAAKKSGTHSLLEDGISKVKNGVTTLEELTRVVSRG